MQKLTSRERLMRIFRNQPYDRPALKLWGTKPGETLLRPAYAPVMNRALEVTDIFQESGSRFNIYCGRYAEEAITRVTLPTPNPLWEEVVTTYHTPKGDLTERFHSSTIGAAGYITEYAVKDADDPDTLREKIHACVKLGAKSGRFILCPSAGFMEYPEPEERYLSNLMLYLDEGLKAVTSI
ncbi:MAG: hypothetical protein PUJ35_04375 [Ruminococcus bromii]|nr:hypothetical protein [Ruminococcus bromii]